MTYTVVWYDREGIIDKSTFDAEKKAKDYAIAMFPTRKAGVVAVQIRKDDGTVIYSRAGS